MLEPSRNDEPVSYSASGLPRGLSLDPSTWVISGTICCGHVIPTRERSPRREEDVQPDLLIDPPEPNPDQPPGPPSNPDR